MMKKLKNKAGETLVETLVALLISCLAMAALSSAMSSSANIMSKAREKLKDYYAQNEIIASPASVTQGTEGTVTVKKKTANSTEENAIKLAPGYDENIKVVFYENSAAGENSSVTAYYYKTSN